MENLDQWLNNICVLSDSYKVSHARQYPPKTQRIYSYFGPRGNPAFSETPFFSLQYFMERYLAARVTAEKINEAEEIFDLHFGQKVFNRAGWEYILNVHKGFLPVQIRAIPEGMCVGQNQVMMTVENTDPLNTYWLTNWLETLLTEVWYGCTVAAQGRAMKKLILAALQQTGDPGLIDFKLHDFGFRGVTCPEQAAIGGAAHLVNFKGTDTIPGVLLARRFYKCPMAGFSIPASEHSTITSWGSKNEIAAMKNMLEIYPEGLMACVSDSFDIYNACTNIWGGVLRDQVLARKGVLVVRPDSGNPLEVVPKVLGLLAEKFGAEKNEKGYLVLNPKVRVIQGDGIDFAMLSKLLDVVKNSGFSADNLAFGSGGGLLQKMNRDTQKFAFKCSSATVDNEERDVFKCPITDNGKKSKTGRFKLIRTENGDVQTVPQSAEGTDLMQVVYDQGVITRRWTWDEVRANATLAV